MEIEVNVKRSDVIRVNLFPVVITWRNLRLLVILWVVVGFFAWRGQRLDTNGINWPDLLFSSFVTAALWFVAVWIIVLILNMFGMSEKSGITGKRVFRVEDNGLREVSDVNDSLHYWDTIRLIEKRRYGIYVRLASHFFYVLPKREFPDEASFESFFRTVQERWKGAAQATA